MTVELLSGIGTWSLGGFWIPLAGWTVFALAGMAVLQWARSLHPLVGYRLGQALLLGLPAGLAFRGIAPAWGGTVGSGLIAMPGPALMPGGAVEPVTGSGGLAPSAVGIQGDGVGLALSMSDLPPVLLGVGFVLVLAAAAVALHRVGRSLLEVRRLARSVEPIRDEKVLSLADQVFRQVGVGKPVAFAMGPEGTVPMTFGWRAPVVVVPADLLADQDGLRMALRHELVHVRRRDYPWAVAEAAVAALFACHPLMPVLARQVADLRERSCDLEVTSALKHPAAYGELLVAMAGRVRSQLLVAAGIAPPPSKLRQRLETMTRHLDASHSPTRGRVATLGALLMALSVSVVAACAPDGREESRAAEDRAAEEVDSRMLTSQFGMLSEETRDETLRRLDVQMSYLVGRIEDLAAMLRAGQEAGQDHPQHIYEQYQLLNRMYLDRLETYETLKLEAETERLLGEAQ